MVATLIARGAAILVAAMLLMGSAAAQELSGTLKRVKESGHIVLGYRESSLPFSYLDKRGAPIGYSLDLCYEIVDDVAAELGAGDIAVEMKPVTSETRIAALRAGEIDLECGSTTSNLERQKEVAFSPIFFVSGTKLLVRRGSHIASLRDLAKRTVAVTAGTTNAAAIRSLSDKQKLDITILSGRDHADSFAMLAAGRADAFATDDVLLYGLIANPRTRAGYEVVGDFLSYDPYGLMFRKDDPDFAAIVERTFARLAESRELERLYDKWFLTRLPTGERLNLPMSPQLREIFRALGLND
jgi:glutamate/aspartate transport system substrate-binding protein